MIVNCEGKKGLFETAIPVFRLRAGKNEGPGRLVRITVGK